jgi:hypothetical protein
MRKSSRAHRILAIAAFASLIATTALSQDPCMSDKELSAYLRQITLTSVGYGTGVCMRRFPVEIRPAADTSLQKIKTAHARAFERNGTASAEPFRRAFGRDQGKAEHDNAIKRAVDAGAAKYEAFSLAECRDHIRGLDVLFDLVSSRPNSEVMLTNIDRFVALFWTKERARAERCD